MWKSHVSYVTWPHKILIRYEQRIWIEPDSVSTNNLSVKVRLSLCYWNQSQHFPANMWQRENLLSVMHWISFVYWMEGNLETFQASLLDFSIDTPWLLYNCYISIQFPLLQISWKYWPTYHNYCWVLRYFLGTRTFCNTGWRYWTFHVGVNSR